MYEYSQNRGFYLDCLVLFRAILLCVTEISAILTDVRAFSWLARFPRSRLATLSCVKISMCSYEKLGWPGYRDLGKMA